VVKREKQRKEKDIRWSVERSQRCNGERVFLFYVGEQDERIFLSLPSARDRAVGYLECLSSFLILGLFSSSLVSAVGSPFLFPWLHLATESALCIRWPSKI
jgi:hypothetical protein